MICQSEKEKQNWIYLYLDARNYRINNDYEYIRVYDGADCVITRKLGTNELTIYVDLMGYNDLKAIMEVL